MHRRRLVAVATAFALPVGLGLFLAGARQQDRSARLFAQVFDVVARTAVDSLSDSALYERAARGLVAGLNDPYAGLYSPTEIAAFQRNTIGNRYGGLGLVIQSHEGRITIFQVYSGTPAGDAGVQQGDRILRVDTTAVTGKPLEDVSQLLLGEPGTSVRVAFERPGLDEPIEQSFTRAVIRVPSVPYALHFGDGVGYVPIQRFNETAAEDVARALIRLREEGARGFILDVRSNPGGDLDAALNIVNLFLKEGQEIARVQHRGQQPEIYHATGNELIGDLPVVVLVDGFAASASEIIAGSLQDHDRGLVIGQRSFGKGLVQTVRPLDNGWALRITTGKWYTPSGRSIQSEHAGYNDERFVESDSTGERPKFRSTGGRVILGGGGVTPDVAVPVDSATPAERAFLQAAGSRSRLVYVSIFDVARELRGSVRPDFTVEPAWRDRLYEKMRGNGIEVTRAQFDGVRELFDALLEERVAQLAFGDSAAYRRRAGRDEVMKTAVDLLEKHRTQGQLLAAAPPPR